MGDFEIDIKGSNSDKDELEIFVIFLIQSPLGNLLYEK